MGRDTFEVVLEMQRRYQLRLMFGHALRHLSAPNFRQNTGCSQDETDDPLNGNEQCTGWYMDRRWVVHGDDLFSTTLDDVWRLLTASRCGGDTPATSAIEETNTRERLKQIVLSVLCTLERVQGRRRAEGCE